MGTVRPYGPWSRLMLESVRGDGLLNVDAFVQWMDEQGVKVDRTLVSHWGSGRSHLPADLLPLLSRFTGHPERVFGPFLREMGCEVMRLPDETTDPQELLQLFLLASAQLGHLQQALIDAIAPEGPGGEAITSDERDELLARADTLIEQLVQIRAHLRELEAK